MRHFTFFLLFCSCAFRAMSQQVISSSGIGTYTIGETIIFTSSNGTVTQGFQQVFLKISALSETKLFEISVYPNPTSDKVRVAWTDTEIKELSLILYSSDGKQLLIHQAKETTEDILDLSAFTSGIYLLKLTDRNNHTAEFKIVKQ